MRKQLQANLRPWVWARIVYGYEQIIHRHEHEQSSIGHTAAIRENYSIEILKHENVMSLHFLAIQLNIFECIKWTNGQMDVYDSICQSIYMKFNGHQMWKQIINKTISFVLQRRFAFNEADISTSTSTSKIVEIFNSTSFYLYFNSLISCKSLKHRRWRSWDIPYHQRVHCL